MLSVQLKQCARVLCLGSFVLSLGLGRAARGAAEPPASLGLDYSLTVFGQESGLAEHALASVAAASDGRLYYSTFSSLGRFDGNRCENLSAEALSPLAGVRTRKLFVDQRGRLWVGADGRILCQETNGWRSFGGAEGVPPAIIREFAETPSGVLWAASASNVVRLAGDRFESMPTPPGLNEERCFLAADQDGALWCAGSLCLSRFAAGRWETMLQLPPTRTNRFMGLLAARSGGLWVAFERELKLWQGGVWTKVWPRPAGLIGDAVEMLEDARGHLWVGGWRSGLVAYRPDGQARQATTRDGLANDSVSDLAEDREGNIWLSSNGGGLVRLRPLAFRRYGQEAGLAQIANSIAEEAPGRMLIGTHGDGVARWEAGRINGLTFWPETNFLAGVWVHGVLRDRSGDTWAATYSPGLLRLHQGRWERIPTDQTGARIILALFEDREGRLWVGTAAGLAVRENGEFTVCGRSSGLPQMAVRAVGQDGAGDIWVCGPGDGLFRRQGGQFVRFPVPGLAADAPFQSLAGGRDGSLWVGLANGGLVLIRAGRCWTYGVEQGLPALDVSALVEDDRGDLWLGGAQGVIRVNRASLEAVARQEQTKVKCQVFDSRDGLPGPIRSGFQPVCWKASDGRLWFATLRGIAVVDPQTVRPSLPSPRTEIIRVVVDGRAITNWGKNAQPLRLSAASRQLEVYYSVLRLGVPERLHFQRRLNAGEDWEEAGQERFTHMHNLRPGRYRFEVRAADIDGVWGDSARLDYVMVPYFWQKLWFIGLALAVVGSVGWLAYRRRLAVLEQLRLAQAKFSRQLMDREEQWRHTTAVELHDGLGQLLQVIRNRAVMAAGTGLSPAASEHVDAIAQTAEQAVGEARDIVRSLRPHYLEQLGLTRSLHYLVSQLSQAGPVTWERSIDYIDPLLPAEKHIHLYRVVQECLTNVARHSGATSAGLIIRQAATELTVEIWDNGRGLPGAAAEANRGELPGLGLRSIQERIHFLGGDCRFQPAPQGGLRVAIRIPIAPNDHDSEDQDHHRG